MVQEHMNHMSSDMTKYYFRDDYEIRETLLYKSNKNGDQLIICTNNNYEILIF